MEELERVSAEEFRSQTKTPIILILENVRSALNVGSAFRTADSFAVEKIFLCGITATPPHREIMKTALGSTNAVEWEYANSVDDLAPRLRKEGWKLMAVEQAEASVPLQEIKFPREAKIALVFGNEVEGVSENALKEVEACIEIPQFGTKHSLNIAVCVGIVVWDLFYKWRYQ